MAPATIFGSKLKSSVHLAPSNEMCPTCKGRGRIKVEIDAEPVEAPASTITYCGHVVDAPGFDQDSFTRAMLRAFCDDLQITPYHDGRRIVHHVGCTGGYVATREHCELHGGIRGHAVQAQSVPDRLSGHPRAACPARVGQAEPWAPHPKGGGSMITRSNQRTVPEVSCYSREEIEGGVIIRYMIRNPEEVEWRAVKLFVPNGASAGGGVQRQRESTRHEHRLGGDIRAGVRLYGYLTSRTCAGRAVLPTVRCRGRRSSRCC
jgi:hypothetical protein